MPLPWKKSKSSRISRFVSGLQQSPKHGGSLVVETGFPTSLIDLFVKNRDRLKKPSSKRINKNKAQTTQTTQTAPTRRRVSSPPPPPLSLQRRMSLPLKLDPALVTEDPPLVSKIEESFVPENRHDGDEDGGGNRGNRGGGGCCVLMVVVFKVFMVAVLALSTKKLAVGITLSAFALLFLELAVARIFTLLNLCPDGQIRIDSLIEKLIGKRRKDKLEKEEESTSTYERRNKVSFEIIEEPKEDIRVVVPQSEKRSDSNSSTLEKTKPVAVQTIRDVVFKNEKCKSAKLKSKIVKKIVPKKLRSYKKKKKMKSKEKEEEEEVEIEVEEVGSVTEVFSLYSEERIESEISERDDVSSNPPLLESCAEIEGEEEIGSKGDLTKVIGLIVIVLLGLFSGKVFAIGLTLSWCLILRVFCCKSQTSL